MYLHNLLIYLMNFHQDTIENMHFYTLLLIYSIGSKSGESNGSLLDITY